MNGRTKHRLASFAVGLFAFVVLSTSSYAISVESNLPETYVVITVSIAVIYATGLTLGYYLSTKQNFMSIQKVT